ncbi:MAG: PRC-barrel protein [Blastococcus sp.]|nr:PRC-barrel protein [Blastococcus sp.]
MLSERELSAAVGTTAYDGSGDKIGTVEHFFVDDRTGAPTWVAVTTGLFGTRHSVVPAVDASFDDGGLRLPVSVDAVKSAPHVAGDHLDPGEEAELRRHYGLDAGTSAVADVHAGVPAEAPTEEMRVVQPPVPVPPAGTGGPADGAMTRSEERLRVGTERVATTRARLVKYVVTEEVQITVPIRREEIRVEQVPLDAVDDVGPGESLLSAEDRSAGWADGGTDGMAGGGAGGPTSGELPDEIILHTERPVVTVEVVPTERVRLRTEVVQGQETITEQVQREQIVVDQDVAPRTTARAGQVTDRADGPLPG